MTAKPSGYRALLCVTSCRRPGLLRRYLPHFAQFCEMDPRFSLVVSLDGTEGAYLDFCDEWDVPLIYSDEREGVGLSKNRALKQFPDFDYYCFVEDDVEVVDGSALSVHVDLAQASGIHHFSLFHRGALRKPIGDSVVSGIRILHGMFGGADVNFFTREGLERVGGWHPLFARFRRGGHTEHSYRFFRAGLAPAPFNVAEELADAFIWHSPPAVTKDTFPVDEDQLIPFERELIDQELEHVPVETISPFHSNSKPLGRLGRLAATLDGRERYPLVAGRERRESRSDLMLWRSETAGTSGKKLTNLIRAAATWPRNPAIRHHIKMTLIRWRGSRN